MSRTPSCEIPRQLAAVRQRQRGRLRCDGGAVAPRSPGAAIAEVWRACYEFESTKEKYAAAEALLKAGQEAYAANLETYRNGLSTIVELLSGRRVSGTPVSSFVM